MNEFVILAYLFFGLVLLYSFGYVYIWVRRNKIMKQRDMYQQLVRHARSTRKQYIQSLDILDNSKLKLDTQLEELRAEKVRLQHTKATLREIAAEIRTRQSADKIDKIDTTVLAQRKVLFAQHWKVLNNFRCRYNFYLQTCRVVECEYRKHAELATNCSRDWETEKSALLAIYNELRDVANLADPRMLLTASD